MSQPRPTALVTGASRGIGRAIALALGHEGFNVVVNYASNAAAADEVKRLIEAGVAADPHPNPRRGYRERGKGPQPNPLPEAEGVESPAPRGEGEQAGPRALAVQADISVATDRRRLVEQTVAAFGRIDLLVNNAGLAPQVRADVLEASEESFDRMIAVNLKGPYFLSQLVAKKMIEQQARRHEGTEARSEGKGATASDGPSALNPNASRDPVGLRASVPPCLPRIVIITSISAYTASTNRGDYCLAKAGLAMVTKLYAARLAEHGINVYEIRPGIIETDMTGPVKAKYDRLILEAGLTPIARWGQGEDVARAVVAVANDLLPFSTGEVINVDGGFHLRLL